MKNPLFTFILSLFLLQYSVYSQGFLTISTDTTHYSYGQSIHIELSIFNPSDSTFNLYGSSSCQAQFLINDSALNTICTADEIILEFKPGTKRTYKWTINPEKLGLPNINGTQRLIGYYPGTTMRDTTDFEAPIYFGGELSIAFADGLVDSTKQYLRDSLNVEVLYSHPQTNHELWRVSGFLIDSLVARHSNDPRFRYIETNRWIQYDSITVTGILSNTIQPEKYFISQCYPNPFNPITSFNITVKDNQKMKINIFNSLGQQICTLFEGFVKPNQSYTFKFIANEFPSGLYLIQIKTENFIEYRKAMLIK